MGEAGARLVGGCCGTTPEHISYMRLALDDPERQILHLPRLPSDDLSIVTPGRGLKPTRMAQRLAKGDFVGSNGVADHPFSEIVVV